ncbi:hypothetical protein [Chitinolyticbacter meiyuanensis]|uniref:hypothetical protein n=1 Tax=Chitinolyticbacter meiyuanensis TaxID=682798 RepID=UPI0011E5FCBC|nr:hypothetical protein [Chitinolyticbacter meiyuanensis]
MHNIFIQRDLHVDCSGSRELVRPLNADWSLRAALLQQVDEAFAAEPSLDNVLQGLRHIHLGRRGARPSYFPSKKNAPFGRTSVYMAAESRLEAAAALMFERDPHIVAYRMQAITVPLPGNRTAYPDFVTVDKQGCLLVTEVKVDRRHQSADVVADQVHIGNVLGRWGIDYQVLDTWDLPAKIVHDNLLWLHSQYHTRPDDADCAELLAQMGVEQATRYTYGELHDRCCALSLPVATVPHLLFIGALQINWKRIIDDTTEIWI